MQEFVMTLQRVRASVHFSPNIFKLALNDPKRQYYSLAVMGGPALLEHIFVMYRRTMVGAMTDSSAIVLAVVVTALEEAILRSTLVQRDYFFRELLGYSEQSDAERMYQRRIWAASTCVLFMHASTQSLCS